MVVGQQNIFDRLVRDLRDASSHVVSQCRSRLCIDDHYRIVADDDAGVWIAFRRVSIEARSDLIELNLLFAKILGRSESRHHQTLERSNRRFRCEPEIETIIHRSTNLVASATMLSIRGKTATSKKGLTLCLAVVIARFDKL